MSYKVSIFGQNLVATSLELDLIRTEFTSILYSYYTYVYFYADTDPGTSMT